MVSTSTFGDDEKLIHLVREVSMISGLRQTNKTADMLAAYTCASLGFSTCFGLLSSAAAQFEANEQQKEKRLKYTHALSDIYHDDFHAYHESRTV
jgi:hypothetical protein